MAKIEIRALPAEDGPSNDFGLYVDGELKLKFGWYYHEGWMEQPDGTTIDDNHLTELKIQ